MGQYSRYKTYEIICQILKELSSILFKQVFITIRNNNDGTKKGANEFQSFLNKSLLLYATGKIGQGQDFDGFQSFLNKSL